MRHPHAAERARVISANAAKTDEKRRTTACGRHWTLVSAAPL
jgi:hypothetical protein